MRLNASAEGYLFYSKNYSVAQSEATGADLDVKLNPITAGQTIELRNIFFETASFDLLPKSTVELDNLARMLGANKDMRIEVGGHTDNVGNDAANQKLSEQRANAVREFLIAKGIDGTRIVAKGYGETKPIATNETEEGRAQNRRTEVTVL
jgi:outer membrane protein OmpA-like peptidoglycan-associated protein